MRFSNRAISGSNSVEWLFYIFLLSAISIDIFLLSDILMSPPKSMKIYFRTLNLFPKHIIVIFLPFRITHQSSLRLSLTKEAYYRLDFMFCRSCICFQAYLKILHFLFLIIRNDSRLFGATTKKRSMVWDKLLYFTQFTLLFIWALDNDHRNRFNGGNTEGGRKKGIRQKSGTKVGFWSMHKRPANYRRHFIWFFQHFWSNRTFL